MATFVRLDESPLAVQDPKPAFQVVNKKKRKKGKKVGQVKATGMGLEGFVDWVNPIPPIGETQGVHPVPHIASDTTKESEDDMSNLVAGFSLQMLKRAMSAQGETTPDFEVPGGKSPKRSGLDEDVQKSQAVITYDSPERASDALPASKGVA